ncbi:MAG: tRNA 5-hydroxyuridine modification protein YegQ [Candidatus Dasytiphilus stammeri]
MLTSELLSPAGTLKNMRYSLAYGADAVYGGPPRYSLRVRNNEFNHENLLIGIQETHALNKKFYLVLNITPHNSKLNTFISDLKPVIDLGPDALIISDPGLIMLVRENFPNMPIHLSVQANAVNWATVKFWHNIGLNRVILSRELSLEEIEEIRHLVPEMELEVFVHGAMCMAYSGRCLLSHYINHRDSNQGTCTNLCRWKYHIKEEIKDFQDKIIPNNEISSHHNKVFTIKNISPISKNNRKNSNEYMTAFEDDHGTYIFNSKDLKAVMHVERLIKIGVHSLKIEGRTKSCYYCARTAQIYRYAIDDAVSGKPFNDSLSEMLNGLANRGYTEGFLRRHTADILQNYNSGSSVSKKQQFVGEFTGKRRGELAQVLVKNKFYCGDNLELMTPFFNTNFILSSMENENAQSINIALGNGHIVWIPILISIKLDYALLIRNIPNNSK